MSSASIQLAAQGMQDVFLTGKPDVTYFSGIYRRHSPFLFDSEEYPFDTPIQYGGSGYVKIPYKGDLLIGTSLKIVLPPLYTPGPGWVYPLPTTVQSNVNPYFNEYNFVSAQTQSQIRTNIPNFKVYFSDGANTISYAQRSVKYFNTYSPISDPASVGVIGQLSSARLVLVTSSNTSSMTTGQTIVFPGTTIPNGIISNPFKVQNFDSGGVAFSYNTIDITFTTPYVFSPIYAPIPISVYDQYTTTFVGSGRVLSATSVPWVRNDFISVTYYDPDNSWRWKSIYSLVKPFSNVFFSIASNTNPIVNGSNIIGLPYFTGNVTVSSSVTSSIVTPVNLSTTEFVSLKSPRIPTIIQYNNKTVCWANLTNIQYRSQFDFSNLYMTFSDFNFAQNLTLGYGSSNPNSIIAVKIAPGGNIITSVSTTDSAFSSNTGGTLYSGLVPLFYTNFSNIVVGNPTTLEFANTIVFPGLNITGLPYLATFLTTGNSFTSNSVLATFTSQPIIPITSNTAVTFSSGGSANVSYSFVNTPVTIQKIAFPTTQSSIFWGFDPASLIYTGARV
jgi:hypothetical protein